MGPCVCVCVCVLVCVCVCVCVCILRDIEQIICVCDRETERAGPREREEGDGEKEGERGSEGGAREGERADGPKGLSALVYLKRVRSQGGRERDRCPGVFCGEAR